MTQALLISCLGRSFKLIERMDKKDKLLKAALELFVTQGLTDAPTSKIAKRAGVATGTLFYFFPTKDDLIVSLYLKLKRQAAENIDNALKPATSPKEIIKVYYEESLKWSLRNPSEFSFLAQFYNSPFLKKISVDEASGHIGPVLEIFKSAIEHRLIAPADVNLLYYLISNQVFGVHQYLLSNDFAEKETNDIIQDTFSMFWKMVEAR